MSWPKPLKQAHGPFPAEKLDGAVAGMGTWGEETSKLAAAGYVPPDMLTALTLFILSSQPKNPQKKQRIPGGGGGVAGGVWVRERFAIYQPVRRDETFTIRGEAVGRHVHKGRRYGTNRCETFDAAGNRIAANLTTGLLAYQVDAELTDSLEGTAPDDLTAPAPSREAAATNPQPDGRLASLTAGDTFAGAPVTVSLAMMAARDTKNPDNPIHSDPEIARKAGLANPIAGGSHVLAFALEVLMQRIGAMPLLHGASYDIRWKAPVFAESTILPQVTVAATSDDAVVFDLSATLDSGAVAMTGRVTVPMP